MTSSRGRIAIRLLLVATLALGLAGPAPVEAAPEGAWSLEARVPASTLAFVSVENVAALHDHFQKTALAQLMRHPDMQAFLAPLGKTLDEAVGSAAGALADQVPPQALALLKQLTGLRGQLAIALVGIDPTARAPDVVASLDFGQNVAQFAGFLQAFRDEIDPAGEHIQTFERDGRTWWQVDGGGMPIVATIEGSTFVLATSADLLSTVLTAPGEGSLAQHAGYTHVRARCAGDALALFAYANVPDLVALLGGRMGGGQQLAMANALGLDTIQGAGYGIAFEGDGFRDTLSVYAPNPTHGLLTLLKSQPTQGELLRWTPAGAFLFNESKSTLDTLVPNARKMAAALDPGAVEQLDQGLAQIGQMIGVDLEKEFLAGLSGEMGMYASLPETGGLFPEMVLFVKAKDGAAFEGIMERLVSGACGLATESGEVIASTRSIPFRDHALHLVDLQAAKGDDPVPFTPTWTRLVESDWFAITLVPHSMKALVLRATSTGTATLAGEEDFQALWASRPPETGEFTYIDMQAGLTIVYDTLVPLLQAAVKPNMLPEGMPALDFALLPPTSVVRPYMRSLATYTSMDDQGLTIAMRGPVPLIGLAAGFAVVAFAGYSRSAGGEMVMDGPPIEAPSPRSGGPKRDLAEVQARDLAQLVKVHVVQTGALPTSLQALVEADLVRNLPKDPWGNPFRLQVVDQAAKRYQVLSTGADGEAGTEDDILVDG